MSPLLQARGLALDGGGRELCRNLSFDVCPGETWAILGRNGIGKSTLLHALAGLRRAPAGEVLLQARSMATMRRRDIALVLGILLQDTEHNFPITVEEAALEGCHARVSAFGWEGDGEKARVWEALEELGIAHLAGRDLHALSGGERRLVELATVFVQDPAVLLLDEPHSHLDLYQQLHVLECVARRVNAQQRAAVMVLHDVNLAMRFCDHAVLMDGNDVTVGPASAVLNERSIARAFRHEVVAVAGPAGPHFVAR